MRVFVRFMRAASKIPREPGARRRVHERRRRCRRTATSNGTTHTIRGEGDDFVTDVIHLIAREGLHVRGFRTEFPTLEDVFLKLTGHTVRD